MAVDVDALRDLLARGCTRKQCADVLGVGFWSVRSAMKRHGLRSTANDVRGQSAHHAPQQRGTAEGPRSGASLPGEACAPRSFQAGPTLPAPPPVPDVADAEQERMRRLVELARRGASMRQVCDALDCSPRAAEAILARARASGYTLDVAGDEVSWRKPEGREPAHATIKPCTGQRFRLGVCSDLHFGSKYAMREQLEDYARAAYASGVRVFVVSGDILDGCYRHGVWELSHHGWDEQARDAFESLPRLDGATWYVIDGNHDETFWGQTGAVSGERLQDYFAQRGRSDLVYLGAREGNLSLRMAGVRRPVAVQLWHPKPGKAYALSYQLQKRIEAYAPGTKPDVLIAGHWHTCVYLETRGVHALAAGCFQSHESSFARSLAGGVSCGGWVLSWECTASGTMRRVAAERWAYFHREESRDVEMVA